MYKGAMEYNTYYVMCRRCNQYMGIYFKKYVGIVWENVGIYGKVWEYMKRCGNIWENVGIYGKMWEYMGRCGSTWEIWRDIWELHGENGHYLDIYGNDNQLRKQ